MEEPVYHQGKKVASVRKYSDTLLIFLLKAHRPDKYRDGVKGKVKDAEDEPRIVVSQLSDEQLSRITKGESPPQVMGA